MGKPPIVPNKFASANETAADSPNVQVSRWGPELTIVRYWRGKRFFEALICGIVFMLIVAVFHGTFIAGTATSGMWLLFVFVVFHASVFVSLAYYALCTAFNRSILRVTTQEISVSHRPLPWLGAIFPVRELVQIFCTRIERRGKGGTSHYTYDLIALYQDGTEEAILYWINDLHEALLIETLIEQHLKLSTEQVPPDYRELTPQEVEQGLVRQSWS